MAYRCCRVLPGPLLRYPTLHNSTQHVDERTRQSQNSECTTFAGKTQPEGAALAAALAAALKACPKLAHHPEAYDKLAGVVGDEKCRQALLLLLATDGFVGKELDLTFPVETLQAQLKSINAAFTAQRQKLSAKYEGATLVLSGTTDEAGQRKALWEVFRRSAGRVAMDDQVEVSGAPDAGRKE